MKSLSKSGWLAVAVVSVLIYGAIFGSGDESVPISSPSPEASEIAEDENLSSELEPVPVPEPEASAKPTSAPEQEPTSAPTAEPTVSPSEEAAPEAGEALQALATLSIKGRAPKTGYSRDLFASGWQTSNGCDVRNRILLRDLVQIGFRSGSNCIIETGVLNDPFTGQVIGFQRGVRTSLDVQIDHVVSLSDAWQKGAQQLSSNQRFSFYNDPLNLLAVWGPANGQKSDSDAASWLPSNKSFRCAFVARQIAVKDRYRLWVTQAEHDAFARVLGSCPSQRLPG